MTTKVLTPTIGIACSLCSTLHVRDAIHTTLTVDDDGYLWLLALCPNQNETIRHRVHPEVQRAVLEQPIAIDPDVLDWLALRDQIDQIWTGVPL